MFKLGWKTSICGELYPYFTSHAGLVYSYVDNTTGSLSRTGVNPKLVRPSPDLLINVPKYCPTINQARLNRKQINKWSTEKNEIARHQCRPI